MEEVLLETPTSMALVVSDSAELVPEFTQHLDALIAVTSAQKRIIMPRSRRTKAERRAYGARAVATLATRASAGFLILVALMTAITALTGHAPIPVSALAFSSFGQTAAGVSSQWTDETNVVSRIPAYTQLKRTDLYDNPAQAGAWGGAACSAAVLAEILTAYGVQHATIGEMIDELGSDISPQWGLVSYNGFGKVASQHGLRADVYLDHPLTYAQMMYITNTLHMPLIVNVRATTGYYHYLSGGHFLVMIGGDNSTIRLVDSSEYYIKSLPLSTFMGMYRNRSVAIVPHDFKYTLP